MSGNYSYSVRTAERYGSKPYSGYACMDVTVSGSQVDLSLRNNTGLFSNVTNPVVVIIRNGGDDISVRFNSEEHDAVFISANEKFSLDNMSVSDVFVTASGATFNITTLGWR